MKLKLGLIRDSPNRCLPTWGSIIESLYPVVVRQLFPAQTTSFLAHVHANINIFALPLSKYCCGYRKSTNNEVRHFVF